MAPVSVEIDTQRQLRHSLAPSFALTGNDRFCNRIAAVKPLFLLWLMSQVDPQRTLSPRDENRFSFTRSGFRSRRLVHATATLGCRRCRFFDEQVMRPASIGA
jgi:hypothetical protein